MATAYKLSVYDFTQPADKAEFEDYAAHPDWSMTSCEMYPYPVVYVMWKREIPAGGPAPGTGADAGQGSTDATAASPWPQ